ncbi:MAG: suppressor of fused domain protein [Phycisphaerales bacterium]
MDQAAEIPGDDPNPLGEICAHMEGFYGASEIVMHELVSDDLHIDVFPIPPSDQCPFWTLYTTGMSEKPMEVPPDAADNEEDLALLRYAEVMIHLPPDWPVLETDPEKARKTYWPIGWLKRAARLPHDEGSWLGVGHTVQFSEPEEEIESGGFAGMVLMPPMGPDELAQIELSDGRVVNVLWLIPLYRDELEFALEEGVEALLEKFEQADLPLAVEVGRKSVLAL